MATPRLSMHKNREILRQKWALGRTHRDVAKSVGVSVGVVAKTLERAATAELDWEAVQALSDDALAVRLYGDAGDRPAPERPLPDFAELHIERQRKGVTLQLLHLARRDLELVGELVERGLAAQALEQHALLTLQLAHHVDNVQRQADGATL